MGRKIFVSYKHNDMAVARIGGYPTTARKYVDILEQYFDEGDHIYKGEKDNEDLSDFKDTTIASHLRDKIFDSSITTVLISKGMKDSHIIEANQWIPWEISYSLKEMSRGGRTSTTNAMLGVVLPDENGSYDYFIQQSMCPCRCRIIRTDILFKILQLNMFNLKKTNLVRCSNCGLVINDHPHPSYIHLVTWVDFISNPNLHIETAIKIKEMQDKDDLYNITKEIVQPKMGQTLPYPNLHTPTQPGSAY